MLDGVKAAGRQARSLGHVAHRPWPVPERRWLSGQTCEDLLFAHWRVPVEELRGRVPDGLEVELYDGSAWLSIVPFRMTALRARGTLPLPGTSSFLELNVRTYVRGADGRPGIWFFSLDASNRLAVLAARRAFRVPCFHARMALDVVGGWTDYECARIAERGQVFSGRYRAAGGVFHAQPGSLEWFLVERYRLCTTDAAGRLYTAEIHHDLWPLQPAEAEIELTSIAPFDVHGEPLCHVVSRQDVLVWPLERLSSPHR